MIRLDIDYIPVILCLAALPQFLVCLTMRSPRAARWILPGLLAFLSLYGLAADQYMLPYPGLFAPDFMMSSALGGFLAFGFALIGAVTGTVLGNIARKYFKKQL